MPAVKREVKDAITISLNPVARAEIKSGETEEGEITHILSCYGNVNNETWCHKEVQRLRRKGNPAVVGTDGRNVFIVSGPKQRHEAKGSTGVCCVGCLGELALNDTFNTIIHTVQDGECPLCRQFHTLITGIFKGKFK